MIAVPDSIQSDMIVPLGMYRRVSEDKTMKGRASSWREVEEQVKEQEDAIRALAASLPFEATITRDYCDNNTPASDPFIVRDDFELMLKDLEVGVIRGILFLHSDRLARLVYDAARVSRVFEMTGERPSRLAATGRTPLARSSSLLVLPPDEAHELGPRGRAEPNLRPVAILRVSHHHFCGVVVGDFDAGLGSGVGAGVPVRYYGHKVCLS